MGKRDQYYKTKVKENIKIEGGAGLLPPVATDSLQSSSTLACVDLLCEGPTEGLVTKGGERAKDFSFLEAIYLDDIPIKEPQKYSFNKKPITMEHVDLIGALNSNVMTSGLDLIRLHLSEELKLLSDGAHQSIVRNQITKLDSVKTEMSSYITKNQAKLGHLGVMFFSSDGIYSSSDDEFFRYTLDRANTYDTSATNEAYLLSNLSFNTFFNNDLQERLVQKPDGDVVQIPESFFFIAPSFRGLDQSLEANTQDMTGRYVGKKYRINDLVGGGVMFFYIGERDYRLSNSMANDQPGNFKTGDFVFSNNSNMYTEFRPKDDRDIFMRNFTSDSTYAGDTSLSLIATNKQTNPSLGDVNHKDIKLGFANDLSGVYNYNNIAFDQRNGYEQQIVLDQYVNASRDIPVNKRLLGPFSQEQNKDISELGDFAGWNLKPSLDHDAYPVIHFIDDYQVDGYQSTITVSALRSTQRAGDDAGRTLPANVMVRFVAGYELSDRSFQEYENIIDYRPEILITQGEFLQIEDETDETSNRFLRLSGAMNSNGNPKTLPSLRLRNINNGNLETLTTNSDMRNYGLTKFDVNKVYYSIEHFSITNPSDNNNKWTYSVDDAVNEANIYFAQGFVQDVEWGNGVNQVSNYGGNGVYFTHSTSKQNTDMGNGLLLGVSMDIANGARVFSPPILDININPPTVSRSNIEQFATLSQALAAGVSLKDYVLKNYDNFRIVAINGISTSQYNQTFDLTDILPNPKDLKNLRLNSTDIPGLTDQLIENYKLGNKNGLIFPGNSWQTPKRYVSATKIDYETDSVLTDKTLSLNYNTESISDSFTYPYSALASSIIDARAFSRVPSRSFEMRLKKVLVPSNYNPLRGDGTDKRFQESKITYGQRYIFNFNHDGHASNNCRWQLNQEINWGRKNVEISLKYRDSTAQGANPYAGSNIQTLFMAQHKQTNSNGIAIDGGTATDGIHIFYKKDAGHGNKRFECQFRGSNTLTVAVDQDFFAFESSFEITYKHTRTTMTLTVVATKADGTTKTFTGTRQKTNSSMYVVTTGSAFDSDVDKKALMFIGGRKLTNTTNQVRTNTQIADLKIKINNQLIHHYDGTLMDSGSRRARVFRDKVGGCHGIMVATNTAEAEERTKESKTVLDANSIFGRNKERVYMGEWDGTFKLAWTDNPAWVLYDLMINPVYGCGNRIDTREDINIFKLYNLGRYCDAVDVDGFFEGVTDAYGGLEPRFSCNLLIDRSENAYQVLSNIGSIFRAISYWDGTALTFSSDKPRTTTAIFNNRNVREGFFSYGDILATARFNRVEVPYADAKDNYAVKVEYVEDEESIRNYGTITNISNGIGCTSRSQAKRAGKYILLSNKLETETVAFQCGSEAMLLTPGDIIQINDDLKNFEFNNGKVLDFQTGNFNTNTPSVTHAYFDVADHDLNKDSILIGAGGGLYTYNNRHQNQLNALRDIFKYDLTHTAGLDSDVYEGVMPVSAIEKMEEAQVSKHQITGVRDLGNGILRIGTDFNYPTQSGISHGMPFSTTLSNGGDENLYKVINVKPEKDEPGLFEINALEYSQEKYDMIENNDFDYVRSTPNIGIPQNTINEPTPPSSVVVGAPVQQANGTFDITVTINAGGGSTETKYVVTAVNKTFVSPYLQEFVRKDSSGATVVKLRGLAAGDYTVTVTSLKNPESSQPYKTQVHIPVKEIVYHKKLIKNITLTNSNNQSYNRISSTGYASGQSLTSNLNYLFDVRSEYDNSLNLNNQTGVGINIYAQTGNSYIQLETGYLGNQFDFNAIRNINTFGAIENQPVFKFELTDNDKVVDTTFCTGYLTGYLG